MIRWILSAISGSIALAFVSTQMIQPSKESCRVVDRSQDGVYPDQGLSPSESFRVHDVVFWGEVSVPTRPCSLGMCAGLNVLRVLKGRVPSKVLVQVATPPGSSCTATLFPDKGSKWFVFAQSGTSRTGYAYWQVADDGPTFRAQVIPNLMALEQGFRALRARLDEAINQSLGVAR